MFCKRCGSQIADEAKFCPRCGEYLLENGTAAHTADMSAVKNAFYKYKYVIIAVAVTIFGVIIGTMLVNAHKKNVEEKEAEAMEELLSKNNEKAEIAYDIISDYLDDYIYENDEYLGEFYFVTNLEPIMLDPYRSEQGFSEDTSLYTKQEEFKDTINEAVYERLENEYGGPYGELYVEIEYDEVVKVLYLEDYIAGQYPEPPKNVRESKRIYDEHDD